MQDNNETLLEHKWNPVRLGQSYNVAPTGSGGSMQSFANAGNATWYNRFISNAGDRRTRLYRFNEMDMQSVEISCAIDTIAEDASCSNKGDESSFDIVFEEDTKVRKTTIKLTEDMKNLWEKRSYFNSEFYYHTREVLKYGSVFFHKKPDGSLRKIRQEELVGYVLSEEDETEVTHYLIDEEAPHMRLSENHQSVKTLKGNNQKEQKLRPVSTDDLLILKIGVGPFGESILERVYGVWRKMQLLEDAVVIYRVCLTGDTKVFTPHGFTYLEDVKVGDQVFCYDSNGQLTTTNVTNKWFTGVKETYEVKSKHFRLQGTDNHPVLTWSEEDGEIYKDIKDIVPYKDHFVNVGKIDGVDIKIPTPRETAFSLTRTDFWAEYEISGKEKYIKEVARKTGIPKNRIRNFLYGQQFVKESEFEALREHFKTLDEEPLAKKVWGWVKNQTNVPDVVDEEFARLFGFLLGDGSLRYCGIDFAEGVDEEQNFYYRDLLRKYFGNCRHSVTPGRNFGNYNTSSVLGNEILKMMGFTQGAHNKTVPSWVYQASPEIRKAFVLGFADADGHYKPTKCMSFEVSICNKKLLEGLETVWNSIGLASGHLRYGTSPAHLIGDRMVRETQYFAMFFSDVPLEKYEKIYTVEKKTEEKVYDIEVAHEEHNFIANSVVVHNCRAPERRVFYIDVGRLPPQKHEAVMKKYMAKQRQKQVMKNGQVSTEFDPHSTTEDFYLPVTSQGRSSRIETLQGGGQMGELSDVSWFARKLAKGLRVPPSMIETHNDQNDQNNYSDMRVGQVYQVEMRYMGYVKRIQTRLASPLFAHLKWFCKERDFIIPEEAEFNIEEPHNFALYREMELNQQALNIFNSTMQAHSLSKKLAMEKYLNMDENEMINNEIMKLREMGISEDQIENMPVEVLENLVYGDKRLGKDYGIEPQDGMGRF